MECFVQSFAQEAFRHAQRKRTNRNSIKYTDISYVANHFSTLHFLQDFLPEKQPAGYVVRRVLDNAGVDTGRSFAAPDEEDDEKMEETTKASKADSKKGKNMTELAQKLARKWDGEPAHMDWRLMSPKVSLTKRPKKNWLVHFFKKKYFIYVFSLKLGKEVGQLF